MILYQIIFNNGYYGWFYIGKQLYFVAPESPRLEKTNFEYFKLVYELFRTRIKNLKQFFEDSAYMYFEPGNSSYVKVFPKM